MLRSQYAVTINAATAGYQPKRIAAPARVTMTLIFSEDKLRRRAVRDRIYLPTVDSVGGRGPRYGRQSRAADDNWVCTPAGILPATARKSPKLNKSYEDSRCPKQKLSNTSEN